jgi:hypothetical protein
MKPTMLRPRRMSFLRPYAMILTFRSDTAVYCPSFIRKFIVQRIPPALVLLRKLFQFLGFLQRSAGMTD